MAKDGRRRGHEHRPQPRQRRLAQRGQFREATGLQRVVQVSFKPLLLAVSINPEHSSYPLLMEGRVFSVNVLQRGQIDLARHFGTRSSGDLDKLAVQHSFCVPPLRSATRLRQKEV